MASDIAIAGTKAPTQGAEAEAPAHPGRRDPAGACRLTRRIVVAIILPARCDRLYLGKFE